MVTNNATYNYDKSLSKLTGAGLPTYTAMPSNGSGTPFWTSTAGGSGYYLLNSSGGTAGQPYAGSSLGYSTRYYASSIASYTSTGSAPYSCSKSSTNNMAAATTAASSSTTLAYTNSTCASAGNDNVYTSSGTQSGTWEHKGTEQVTRTISSVESIRYSDTYSDYAEKFQEYSAYVVNTWKMTYNGGTSPATFSTKYCHQTSGNNVTGSATVTSTSAVYTDATARTCDGCNHSCRNAAEEAYGCASATACHNSYCNTKAKAKATFKKRYNDKGISSDVPNNWLKASYTYNTTNTSDCRVATRYTLTSTSVSIGIRPVITVTER